MIHSNNIQFKLYLRQVHLNVCNLELFICGLNLRKVPLSLGIVIHLAAQVSADESTYAHGTVSRCI